MRRSAETINIEVSNITGRRFGRFRVKFSELAGATWLGVLLLGLLVVMGGALVAAGPGPALSNLSPTQGAHVPTATKVSFTADDPDQINASSAQIAVNGTSIPATVKFREIGHYETRIDPYWGTEYQVWVVDGYDYTSAAIESNAITNPPDVNSVRVSIADGLGNISTAQWTFYSSTPPNIANQTPANGATISTTLPTISAQITDGDGSVDPSSVRMIVDGTPVGVSCNTSYNTTMASYTPPTPLSPGTHTVNLTAKDAVGNAATSAWSFTVPAGSASFSSPAPASGSTVTIPNPTISVLVSSAAGLGGGATMLINGSSVPAVYTSFTPTSGKISYTPASLPDGVTTISVSIIDNSGKPTGYTWSFTVRAAPQISQPAPADQSLSGTLTPTISAKVTDNGTLSSFSMTLDGQPVTVTRNTTTGVVSYTPSSPLNNTDFDHSVTVTAVDSLGLTTSLTWTFRTRSCTDCHATYPVPSHKTTNCDACHGGSVPIDDCRVCHPEITSHGPDKLNFYACETCHTATSSYKVPIHPPDNARLHTSTTHMESCTSCHSNSLSREHPRHNDGSGQPYNCNTCHASIDPTVKLAIYSGNTDCFACHSFSGGTHPGGPDCLGCHGLNSGAPKKIDQTAFACGPHALINAGQPNATGNPLNAACWTCHGDGTQPNDHPTSYKTPKTCVDCHETGQYNAPKVSAHFVNSAGIKAGSCMGCHTPANNMIIPNHDADFGSFDADGDGVNGGPSSPEHYTAWVVDKSTAPWTHKTMDTSDCLNCHGNPANAAKFGNAIQIASDPNHPKITTDTHPSGSPALPSPPVSGWMDYTGSTETVWYYADSYDTAAKSEGGSIRPGADGGCSLCHGSVNGTDFHSGTLTLNTSGPHGDYSSTSNKCKVCHAAHRAQGAYKLLRATDPADACSYCHIGDHRHSHSAAYTDAGTIYPSNGHTIGAGPEIPDSSVKQWLELKTLSAANGTTQEIAVRSYESTKNEIFKWYNHNGWRRSGPVNLYCMACHQVHRASELIWKPNVNFPDGYMLLRNSPSGSINDEAAMKARLPALSTGYPDVIRVVENTLSATTTGDGKTTYTAWKGPDVSLDEAQLSVWCADCHNLNIGYKEAVSSNFGGYSHSDRSHPVPYALGETASASVNGQCYSCHVDDLNTNPARTTGGACKGCHITPEDYRQQAASSDFPHSGKGSEAGSDKASVKLLGDWDNKDNSSTPPAYDSSYVPSRDGLDKICGRCHSDIGDSR